MATHVALCGHKSISLVHLHYREVSGNRKHGRELRRKRNANTEPQLGTQGFFTEFRYFCLRKMNDNFQWHGWIKARKWLLSREVNMEARICMEFVWGWGREALQKIPLESEEIRRERQLVMSGYLANFFRGKRAKSHQETLVNSVKK